MKAAVVLGIGCFLVWPERALAQYDNSSGYDSSGYDSSGYGSSGADPSATQSDSSMEAGGLAPPSTTDMPSAEEVRTQQELARADEEDSGRGLEFFWLNGEIGVEHLGLQTFNANNLVDSELAATTQTGLLYGAGLGVRLIFLTLGARFRLGDFSAYQPWTLNAEVGFRIPIGIVEPYLTFGGGYASLGSFDTGNVGRDFNSAGVDITGFNLRTGFGLDIYLTNILSIGANLTGEMMFLQRPKATEPPESVNGVPLPPEAQEVYAQDGSSIGAGLTGTFVVGLHF